MEREKPREVAASAIQLVSKISEGSYGTVNVAKVVTPPYGQTEADTRLVVGTKYFCLYFT